MNNLFDFIYQPLTPITPGAPAIPGFNLILPPEKVDGVYLLVEYAPGTLGNALTVFWEIGENLLAPPGFQYYYPQGLVPIVVPGPAATNFVALYIPLPGKPSLVRFSFSSAGAAAPLDAIRAVVTGLPTGTVTSP